MKKYISIGIIVIGVAGLIVGITFFSKNKRESMEERISYNRDIRPILSDKCFTCHGPDANKRKVGLRLDLPDGAFAELQKTIAWSLSYQYDMFWHSVRLVLQYKIIGYE